MSWTAIIGRCEGLYLTETASLVAQSEGASLGEHLKTAS
jgi:hypothetical protein